MEEMEMLLTFISNNGFAMVVAGWMIIKQNKETQTLIKAVDNLGVTVGNLCGLIEKMSMYYGSNINK